MLAGGTVAGGASLWHTLGSVAAGLFVLEAVTGIALATVYAPAVNTAWPSVFYIQDQMTMGWFVRGLHSFGSSALIIVAGLHLLQVVLFGAYRRPRELNWMVGAGHAGRRAAVRDLRLPAAVGSEGLLGEGGRSDHHGQRAGRRRRRCSRSSRAARRSAT